MLNCHNTFKVTFLHVFDFETILMRSVPYFAHSLHSFMITPDELGKYHKFVTNVKRCAPRLAFERWSHFMSVS